MVLFRRILRSLTHNPQRTYEVVAPGNVTKQRLFAELPKNISVPPYAESGVPSVIDDTKAEIKSDEEIEKMRASCSLAAKVLKAAGSLVKPGVTTQMIDDLVHEMTVQHGAYPSPLNYKGFPKSVCTSVNNCACHGIPDDRQLVEGDIINIDVTVYLVKSSRKNPCFLAYNFGSTSGWVSWRLLKNFRGRKDRFCCAKFDKGY